MKLDMAAARSAIQPLATKLGLSVERTAWGIHTVVNETMAAAARVHVADRGHSSDAFALLTTGGGGSLHGYDVARRLGMRRLISPPGAGVASAVGLLLAPARVDRVLTVARRLDQIAWPELERIFRKLETDALQVIDATDPARRKVTITRSADMRFAGQGFELNTTLPKGPYTDRSANAARNAFYRKYRAMFGGVPPVSDIEIVNIRIMACRDVPDLKIKFRPPRDDIGRALVGKRLAWSEQRSKMVMTPVYDRDRCASGTRINGPAIVQEASTTLVLPAGARASIDRARNMIVELR
jgi:N-methylhydantoinase A